MKDFNAWNRYKFILENRESDVIFHEREIWLASLGSNIGHEQDGKHRKFLRPTVIIKKFNRDIFWSLPLSTQEKDDVRFSYGLSWDTNPSFAVPAQLRLIDRKRLFKKIGEVSLEEFKKLKELLISFLTPL